MRFLSLVLVAASLIAGAVSASPLDPKNGVEYTTLVTPQPVQATGKKIEVLEFFMYHCPHCNALEPTLSAWVKKQGDKILFRRMHVSYAGHDDPESHMFVTLDTMGKAEEMQDKIFHAWHVDHLRLNTDEAIIDWVGKNGIDKAKFVENYRSFTVMTKLNRLAQLALSYGVTGAPTLIIDGRYVTSPSMVGTGIPGQPEAVLDKATGDVLDALVAKAASEKAAVPAKPVGDKGATPAAKPAKPAKAAK